VTPARLEWIKLSVCEFIEDGDVDALPLAAQGLLVRLWCACARDGSIPSDPREAARRSMTAAEDVVAHWDLVRPFFKPAGNSTSGRLISSRVQAQALLLAEAQGKRRASGKAGAERRWKGIEGGGEGPHEGPHEGHRTGPPEGQSSNAGSDCSDMSSPMANAIALPMANGWHLPSDIKNKEKKENTPPIPPADAGGPKVRRGRGTRKVDSLEVPELPDWVPELAKRLRDAWHKADPDGRPIDFRMSLLVQRLAAIHARQPLYTERVLEGAARDYLASNRSRFKCAHYFFTETPDANSNNKPPFKEWADSRVHLERNRPQPSTPPQEITA